MSRASSQEKATRQLAISSSLNRTEEFSSLAILFLESDRRVLEIAYDNDYFIREVVTDLEVGIEEHPHFGHFLLCYSGPIVDSKPRGHGVLTVKHSKCCLPKESYTPISYDWERECEVEFGLDYAVTGASREYLLNTSEENVTGFPFFADPPRQLVWSKGWSTYPHERMIDDWHPLFGLIGSVLWNELQSEVATLKELFVGETIAPVHWRDVTFSDSDDDEGDNDEEDDMS